MKKLLMSSAVLISFSLSIIFFQMSCKKEVLAQTSSTSLVIYSKGSSSGNSEIWKANIDGSNQQKLNIILPSGYTLNVNGDGGQLVFTSDKQKIIFKAGNGSFNSLFSCSVDGSNLTKIVDGIGTSFDAN